MTLRTFPNIRRINTLNPPALSSPRSLAAAAQALAQWSRAMNPPTWNSKIDGEYLLMIINIKMKKKKKKKQKRVIEPNFTKVA